MSQSAETVVLVHGLWLHAAVFVVLRRRLGRRGFAVRTFSYPTVRHGLDRNAGALAACVAATAGSTIHLVAHSLGGLVVLSMLAQSPDPRIRRVVLMGTPCAGSHCAAVLMRTPGLAAIVGRSLADWLARDRPRLPEGIDIGIIAGSRSLGLGRLVPDLPRPNDGVVTIAETRLAECRDAITLAVGHSEMLVSAACAAQIAAFLGNGRFCHDQNH